MIPQALYMALSTTEVSPKDSFRVYMDFVVNTPPTRNEFIKNMEAKMNGDEFLGDIYEIILPKIAKEYDNQKAFDLVKERLLNHI
jgi:hypothetical protein